MSRQVFFADSLNKLDTYKDDVQFNGTLVKKYDASKLFSELKSPASTTPFSCSTVITLSATVIIYMCNDICF